MQPLVSIVINNYNYAKFLRRAVDSALEQSYRSIEVIVVDDGSTDESRRILEAYESRATIINKPNGGQASAFNVGIAAARGKYILLLDSDDYLFPGAVDACVSSFPEGYSRVYYRLIAVNESEQAISSIPQDQFFRPADGDMFEEIRRTGTHFFPPTSANFFCGEMLKSVLPVPEAGFRISADAYVVAWTGLLGPVKSIDLPLAAYRLHGRNNFYTSEFKYSNLKGLKAHLESYYRIKKLLEDTCRAGGFQYPGPPDYSNYSIVKGLCVAYRSGIQAPYLENQSAASLGKLIVQYLRFGQDASPGRLRRVMYLLFLLFSLSPVSSMLTRLGD